MRNTSVDPGVGSGSRQGCTQLVKIGAENDKGHQKWTEKKREKG
jgi:hypothetical protein